MKRRPGGGKIKRQMKKRERISRLKRWAAVLLPVSLAAVSFFGLFRLISARQAKREAATAEKTEESEIITLGSTGCILLHDALLESAKTGEGYDFSPFFRQIAKVYSSVDFMTCEFEGTIGDGSKAYSGYPAFVSPKEICRDIEAAGVDLQYLASNHVYDGGDDGFWSTAGTYSREKICHTGIRFFEEDDPFVIAEVKGHRIGFMDYTYADKKETVTLNDQAINPQILPLINTFDMEDPEPFYEELEARIGAMKERGAEFIVLQMHWGTEYEQSPEAPQREMAKRLERLGVDALIGGHPHCVQGAELIEGEDHVMIAVYSEGNALSNQRKDLLQERMPQGQTEDGVMVTLCLSPDGEGGLSLTGARLLPTWVYKGDTDDFCILPLDEPASLEAVSGLSGIEKEAEASRARTLAVMGEDFAQINEALSKRAGK